MNEKTYNSRGKFISTAAIIAALYHILAVSGLLTYAGIFIPAPLSRGISLLFVLVLVYSLAIKEYLKKGRWLPSLLSMLLLLLGLFGSGFAVFAYDRVLDYGFYGTLDTIGIIAAACLGASLLIIITRTAGWVLSFLIVIVLLATRFQSYLPGLLHGNSFTVDRLGFSIFAGSGGIFGLTFGVATTIIITFLMFAKIMSASGAGKWFIDLAISLTGWMTGGPAKAAVVASGLMGSISGSAAGNAATIGTITIPLMKSVGYSKAFAGGVESVASTGGIILPPVMGGVAFIMAEWLGITYTQVATAAALPAILYYLVLFMSVHFVAGREKLKPVPRKQLPSLIPTLKTGWYFLVPLFLLIYFMIVCKYRPEIAGLYTIPCFILISFVSRDKKFWLTPKKIIEALQDAAVSWAPIAAITATVGMLVGSLNLSGLGVRFSSFLIDLSGGNLLVTLLFVAIASFVLGMGLDSIPVYLILAVLTGPALIKLGVAPVAAHLFIIFWGLAAFITPPSCTPVFISIAISEGELWSTGWEAMKLGAAIFIVPFAFIYGPSLLMQGSPGAIVFTWVTALIGGTAMAAALQGYFFKRMGTAERLLIGAAGCLLIFPSVKYSLVGLGLLVCGAAWNRLKKEMAEQPVAGAN